MPAGPAPYNMKNLLLFQNFGIWEVLIIAFVVLLLFGGKKIPELMKGLGKGVKSFKEGMSEVEKEIKDVEKDIKPEE
jgi:sec-independent protein translocase protein TatA